MRLVRTLGPLLLHELATESRLVSLEYREVGRLLCVVTEEAKKRRSWSEKRDGPGRGGRGTEGGREGGGFPVAATAAMGVSGRGVGGFEGM